MGKAVARWLLGLYPRAFRERYGEGLMAMYAQRARDAGASRGALGQLSFCVWELGSLASGAVRERVRARWGGGEERNSTNLGMGRAGDMDVEQRTMWWSILREGFVSAARTAKRYPAFTAAVTITLGLGIGANATMYGIVDRLLLRPPAHVVDHERVQRMFMEHRSLVGTGELVMNPRTSYRDYEDLKSHEGLAAVAAYRRSSVETVGNGESATRASVAYASGEFFPLLGVAALRGRFYTAEESAPGSTLTAVLSAEYWTSTYGAGPGVLGRTIEVGGRAHTIIGIAPPGFTGIELGKVDLWLPYEATFEALGLGTFDSRSCCSMRAVVRLQDGVSVQAAEAEATRLLLNARRGASEGPRNNITRIVFGPLIAAQGPEPSAAQAAGESRAAESLVARWLVGVSLIVLLIACANVANLLMARGTRQRKEVAVRIALGAARGRVVGQMMVESVLLALAGGLLALMLARWGGEIVRSTLLPDVYFPNSAVTGRLFVFTVVAALVAGVAAGIVPALQGSRADIAGGLGDASRGSSARRSELRGFLTIAQAAMSVVLLVGAGLFVRSLGEVRSLDLGLDIDRLLLASLAVPVLTPIDEGAALYDEAIRLVSALPGVRSAAATSRPSFQGPNSRWPISVPGIDSIPLLPGGGPYRYAVSPGYFETVGVAILRGRPFAASDRGDGVRVAVVSETMARTLWPDRDGLGECFVAEDPDSFLRDGQSSQECTTVVGVAEDVARRGFQDEPFMAYYLPQGYGRFFEGLYVRAEGDPRGIVNEVAALLRSYSPSVGYTDVQTVEQMLDPQARAWTLGATMFTLFGLLALCLAAIGLYSVLAFDVAQRTRELGIRGALGATKSRLLRSVVYQGAGFGMLGVGLGLGAAYLAAPYAGDLLFEVSPRDPSVFAVVAAALIAVSVAASLIPGLRATHVEPTDALRAE